MNGGKEDFVSSPLEQKIQKKKERKKENLKQYLSEDEQFC